MVDPALFRLQAYDRHTKRRLANVDDETLVAALADEAAAWRRAGRAVGYFPPETEPTPTARESSGFADTRAFAEALGRAEDDLTDDRLAFLQLAVGASAEAWSAAVRHSEDTISSLSVSPSEAQAQAAEAIAWLLVGSHSSLVESIGPAGWRSADPASQHPRLRARVAELDHAYSLLARLQAEIESSATQPELAGEVDTAVSRSPRWKRLSSLNESAAALMSTVAARLGEATLTPIPVLGAEPRVGEAVPLEVELEPAAMGLFPADVRFTGLLVEHTLTLWVAASWTASESIRLDAFLLTSDDAVGHDAHTIEPGSGPVALVLPWSEGALPVALNLAVSPA